MSIEVINQLLLFRAPNRLNKSEIRALLLKHSSEVIAVVAITLSPCASLLYQEKCHIGTGLFLLELLLAAECHKILAVGRNKGS